MRTLKLTMAVLLSGLLYTACELNDTTDPVPAAEVVTEEETLTLIEADDIVNDVDNLIEDYAFSVGELSAKGGDNSTPYLSCMIKTRVEEGETTIVTLDFGKQCTLPFENVVLSGKIIMEYEVDTENHVKTITYTYDDFYYDDVKVEGSNVIEKVRSNENGFHQSTRSFDIKLIWPDEEFTIRQGSKVRTFIEGFDTRGNWGDNVFSITGNWTSILKNGKTLSAEITTPLIRKTACRFIVSGVIEKHINDNVRTLDFGDGECDNVATVTKANGDQVEIALRKRKRKLSGY